ncbi:ABC transporter permease [Vitiosangium sp. GDMCC 1.1324]|uniref:ABC transporter permease n=1 Tax=Vitiosangium sp. (strain GDMCC 1.1324) TaxID=2138576 RepID=UPI000D3DBA2D|nr:ABC transporter permease [Vitiosangium sp. GDMCC 1.1324]PTL83057.1 ABC transporter permease [Vitiosangium sp. GDMCC 1.1324]
MRALLSTVFRKELRDHLRDRRSVMSALGFTLMGPIIFGVMFTVMASWFSKDKPLELPVVGRAHAPSLIAFLERSGATLTEPPADYEARIQAGKLDAVLIIPEDYGKDFEAGRTASVHLVMDNSRNQARSTIHRVEQLLNAYSGMLGSQRLLARGVAPELAAPVKVEEVDLSTPERLAANLLTIIPIFLVLAAFSGGMNVAIDAMAGERERGSLESLLLNPVQREALVAGKWLATVVFACAAATVCLMGFMAVMHRVPLQDLGVKVRLDAATVLGLWAAVLPLALMASSAQMLLSTFARSFKEAQTYMQLLTFLPTLPGMVLVLSPVQSKTWMFAVPVLGQEMLVQELMRGESMGALPFLLGLVSCGTLALVFLACTARLLGDERIIFGRS